jgi:hypothetical protein
MRGEADVVPRSLANRRGFRGVREALPDSVVPLPAFRTALLLREGGLASHWSAN